MLKNIIKSQKNLKFDEGSRIGTLFAKIYKFEFNLNKNHLNLFFILSFYFF
jgi:hypothetical protein